MANKIQKISVRELVEFVYRSGDIDSTYNVMSQDVKKSMTEGIRLHNKVQKQRIIDYMINNEKYQREVSVKCTTNYNQVNYEIKGRIDGLVITDNIIIIDEIKSTARDIQYIEYDTNMVHVAQAMIYGYIVANEKNMEKIKITMTYVSSINEEEKILEKQYFITELRDFFMRTIEIHYKFIKLMEDKFEEFVITANKMEFPYTGYRKNQREFMSAVYSSIREKKKLFGEAPTGVGKTLSTLFPSVKALGNNMGSKIFYLTSKTITRTVAEESIELMEKKGLRVTSVTFTAKDKICVCDMVKCLPNYCDRAKGHFDRINDALYNIVSNERIISKEIIKEYSKKHNVCPFEFQLDISNFSTIVVCDYNYVYNPRVYLRRFFENEKTDFIILADEAHNLESRARDMFSAVVEKKDFLSLKKIFISKKMVNICKEINAQMLALSSGIVNSKIVLVDEIKSLAQLIEDLKYHMDTWLQNNQEHDEYKEVLEIYFKMDTYLKTSTYYDEKYRMLINRYKNDVTATLLCIDPSTRFEMVNVVCRNIIFFSATLTPIHYFSHLYGGNKNDYSIKLSSPFSNKNTLLMKDTTISTYYKDRENSYEPIAKRVIQFANGKVGNYFVFFSSYEYMEKVYDEIIKENQFLKIIMQTQNMAEDSKEWFLNQFTKNPKETTIGFLVLGGIFSEGINLVGDRLIGVCIVGVGVPKVNFVDNVIKDYHDNRESMGYEYAYMFPGMNKVLQGAGRVIRDEKDRGVILLLDSRYRRNDYINLFPKHWENMIEVNEKTMSIKLKEFWEVELDLKD